jgi:hypothetical protein
VQGAENLLVWGARETIRRERPAINIEDDPEFTARMTSPENVALFGIPPEVVGFSALTWLKKIGYRIEHRLQNDLFMVHSDEPGAADLEAMRVSSGSGGR